MGNSETKTTTREDLFFASIKDGQPGIYTLDRMLTQAEKTMIPSPSRVYFFAGTTIVRIYHNVEKYLANSEENISKRAREQFHDGIKTILRKK